MYDRSDADEWHDDVFVSAIVRLVPKMEKAWAAPGDGVAESESGKLAGGRRARQHCGHRQARFWQGPMNEGKLLTVLHVPQNGGPCNEHHYQKAKTTGCLLTGLALRRA
jgi:hypothetical protein